jgi:hypothetical protein
MTVFVDVFVQRWGMVQVGAEVWEFGFILFGGHVGGFLIDLSRHRMSVDFLYPVYHGSLILVNSHFSDCDCILYFL